MWMRYYPLLKGRLDTIIDFENNLRCFADDQNKESCLTFSARRLIPTSRFVLVSNTK